jgi:hypothetical protein
VKTEAGSSAAAIRAGDYALRYTGMRSQPGAQSSERTFARFDVLEDGMKVGEGRAHPRDRGCSA